MAAHVALVVLALTASAVLLPAAAEGAVPCERLRARTLKKYNKHLDDAARARAGQDFRAAIESLEEARTVCDEDPTLLLRMAQWTETSGAACREVEFRYRAVLLTPANKRLAGIIARTKDQAQSELDALITTGRCGPPRIAITCEQPGVTVVVGDVYTGQCPADPVVVTEGEFAVTARLDGYASWTGNVVAKQGEVANVAVPLLTTSGDYGDSTGGDGSPSRWKARAAFTPTVAYTNAPLEDDDGRVPQDRGGARLELDGYQNSQIDGSLDLGFVYDLSPAWAVGSLLRVQFASFSPQLGGYFRYVLSPGRDVEVAALTMLFVGPQDHTMLLERGREAVASAGPVAAGPGLEVRWATGESTAFVVGTELLAAFPDVSVHIGLTAGGELRF